MAANENELKVVFSGDAGPVKTASDGAAESVKKFGDAATKAGNQAAQGFDKLKKSVQDIPQAFDEIAAGKAAMDRISKSIDEAVESALKASKGFDQMGGHLPLADMKQLRDSVNQLKRDLAGGLNGRVSIIPRDTPQIANNTAASLAKLKNVSGSAALALNDVGRIAQDLPFGLIGIQNNLNPMLESFRRLKAETGSTGAALKAMASSLGGVGGLGLAISVASSAFVIFQNGIAGFNRKTKEATDKAKEFVDTMKSVEQTSGEAGASVFGQISVVNNLAAAIVDTNRSYTERKNALEQLQGINKNYFGDLKMEADSLRTVASRVTEYTNALVAQAIVKSFSEDIGNVNKELFTQSALLDKAKTALDQARKAKQDFGKLTYTDTRGNEVLKEGAGEVEAAVVSAEKAFLQQRDIVEKLGTQYGLLQGAIDGAVKESLKFKPLDSGGVGGKKEEIDLLQRQIDKYEDLAKAAGLTYIEERKLAELRAQKIQRDDKKLGVDQGIVTRKVNAELAPFNIPESDVLGDIDKLITERFRGKFIELEIPTTIIPRPTPGASPGSTLATLLPPDFNKPIVEKMQLAGQAAGEAYRRSLVESINRELNQALVGAVQGIGDVIGETLGAAFSGEKVNPFKSFILVIAESIRQLGQALIAFGIAKKLTQEAFKSANPMAIIAGGIGLIATGTALKSLLNKAPKFAEGGLVTGPTLGLVGEAGPELIIPLNRADQYLGGDDNGAPSEPIELVLRGLNLMAAIDRNTISRRRRGGA